MKGEYFFVVQKLIYIKFTKFKQRGDSCIFFAVLNYRRPLIQPSEAGSIKNSCTVTIFAD